MQTHRFADLGSEPGVKPRFSDQLVPSIQIVLRDILRQSVQQMADVVEERGDHEVRFRAGFRGEPSGLERVFQDRDALAEVRFPASPLEQIVYLVAYAHAPSLPLRRTSAAVCARHMRGGTYRIF